MTWALLGAPLVLAFFLFAACEEEGGSVQFTNTTDSSITVLYDDQPTVPPTLILPGESAGVGTVVSAWPTTITVEDPVGQVIFCQRFTWDEIESQDFQIVIDERKTGETEVTCDS